MKVRLFPAFGIVLLMTAASGCKCEGNKLMNAARDFIDFGSGEDRVMDPYKPDREKGYSIRRWKEENLHGRHRAVADVEVDVRIDREKLEKVLRDAVHDDTLQRSTSAVMVRAWPGKLETLAAPLGIAIFARDGHGWDGKSVGFEKIHVLLPTDRQAQDQGLQPLDESEYLMLLGVENVLRQTKDMAAAQRATAERHGIGLERVQAACTRGLKLARWLKDRQKAVLGP